MGMDVKFKHGIWIGVPYTISISSDAEIWNMQADDAFKALLEAKDAQKYVSDLCLIYSIDADRRIYDVGYRKDILIAMQRIDKNIFAEEDDKNYCHDALKRYSEYLSKKAVSRAPNRTLRKRIIERDNSKCRYCGRSVNRPIHIDHVIPYSLGGRTEIENLVTACSKCNLGKSGKTLEESGMKLL